MRPFRIISVLIAVALSALVFAGSLNAQVQGLLSLERLSLLDTWKTGGRPLGLGSAYTAISDDAFSLIFNPAGLVQIEDRELSIGIHHSQVAMDNIYESYRFSGDNSSTSFGHIAYINPMDTYGGNIVVGLGMFRSGSSDLEYVRNAVRNDLGGTIENSLLQSGTIYQYRFGLGVELTPRIAVGANLVLWNESVDFSERIAFEDGSTDYSYVYEDNATADLDGISLELGLLVWLAEYVKAGLTIATPSKLYYDGDAMDSYTGTFDDGTPWTTDDEYGYIEEEFTTPMKFTGGLCFEVETLVLAADMSYSDYSQTKYDDLRLSSFSDPGRDILESVFSYSIGAEYMVPGTTISLRAGYSFQPLKINGMDEISYITDTPDVWRIDVEYDFVDIEDERQFFTFGAGSIIDDVLALDLGVVFGSYKRKTQYLTDQRDLTEVVITGAYRF